MIVTNGTTFLTPAPSGRVAGGIRVLLKATLLFLHLTKINIPSLSNDGTVKPNFSNCFLFTILGFNIE